jgi:hypothetical protein
MPSLLRGLFIARFLRIENSHNHSGNEWRDTIDNNIHPVALITREADLALSTTTLISEIVQLNTRERAGGRLIQESHRRDLLDDPPRLLTDVARQYRGRMSGPVFSIEWHPSTPEQLTFEAFDRDFRSFADTVHLDETLAHALLEDMQIEIERHTLQLVGRDRFSKKIRKALVLNLLGNRGRRFDGHSGHREHRAVAALLWRRNSSRLPWTDAILGFGWSPRSPDMLEVEALDHKGLLFSERQEVDDELADTLSEVFLASAQSREVKALLGEHQTIRAIAAENIADRVNAMLTA